MAFSPVPQNPWEGLISVYFNYPAEALLRKLPAYVITCNCDVIGEVLQKITMPTCWISTNSNEDFQPFDLSISCKVTNKRFNDLPIYIIVYLSAWSASSIWDRKTEGKSFYLLSEFFCPLLLYHFFFFFFFFFFFAINWHCQGIKLFWKV